MSDGRDNFSGGLVFVPTCNPMKKKMFFLVSGINHCNRKRSRFLSFMNAFQLRCFLL